MQLTHENYYSPEANAEYMSNSQLKGWLDCARKHVATVRGEWPDIESTALLVGKYVDAALLEPDTLPGFIAQNLDAIQTKKGELRADFQRAELMIARCRKDETFMSALDGEHQVIAEWEMFGVPWRCKFDVVDPSRGILCDLKTCRDFEPTWDAEKRMKLPFYESWGYWRQLAVYREGYKSLFGEYPAFNFIAAVTKEPSPRIKVIDFNGVAGNDGADRFAHELKLIEESLNGISELREWLRTGEPTDAFPACGRCDYCAATLPCAIETAESLVWK